jgi:hypothetical protein
MRKLFFLLLAMCLGIFLPSNASAWDVCEISAGTPTVALELSFTSSFCSCLDEDVITIQITPTNSAVVIDSVVFTKAIPHSETDQSRGKPLAVNAYDYLRINVKQKCLYNNVISFASVPKQKT